MCTGIEPAVVYGAMAVGAAAAGTGLVMQHQAAGEQQAALERQSKAAQEANALQRQQAELKVARERMMTVRQARIQRAQAISAGETQSGQGSTESSSIQGGTGSIQSQLAGNLAFLDQAETIFSQTSEAQGRAMQAASEASGFGADARTWGGVANLGGTIFSGADTIGKGAGKVKGWLGSGGTTELTDFTDLSKFNNSNWGPY